jgi:hypothetical protein
LYGAFVWARRALNGPKRRFPARAVLLGRIVFAQGYYSGIAEKKDNGAFGYMLGIFPLFGLAWLFLLTELKVLTL